VLLGGGGGGGGFSAATPAGKPKAIGAPKPAAPPKPAALHHPDSSSEGYRYLQTDDEHVGGVRTDTRKRPSNEQLGHKTAGGSKTDTHKHPPDEQLDPEPVGGGSASRIRTGAPAVVGGTMSQSGLLTCAGGGLHPLAQGVQLTHCGRKHLHNQKSWDQCRHHG
jgi:hypothetical protein